MFTPLQKGARFSVRPLLGTGARYELWNGSGAFEIRKAEYLVEVVGWTRITARFDVEDRLLAIWRTASRDLGVRFEAPFKVVVDSGATVVARLLLRDFEAAKGMLIVTDYSVIKPYAEWCV